MRIITLIFFSILLFSCNEKEEKTFLNHSESTAEHIKDSLAFELCAMFGLDQGIRDMEIFSLLGRTSRNIDTLSFNRLVKFIKTYGYPNKQLVGEKNWEYECVGAAAMAIMLHNPHRLVNESEYLNLFLSEVEKGNMKREFLATVLDKHYWSRSRGEKVLYGSAFGTPCLQTKEETNAAREKIGLLPLEDSEFKDCEFDLIARD